MSESSEHIHIKETLRDFFRSHYEASIDEYPDSGFETDVFAVSLPLTSILVEIIWTATKQHFLSDVNRVLISDAEIKIVIASPKVLKNPEFLRYFEKMKLSETKKGYSVIGMLKWNHSDEESFLKELKSKIDKVLREKKKPMANTPLIVKTSRIGWTEALVQNLDPKLDHVYAVFFYPPEVSWRKAERNPFKRMPRFKAVVNYRTKTAYWMLGYAQGLFLKGKIQYVTETGSDERDMKQWVKRKGIRLEEKPASESDLL